MLPMQLRQPKKLESLATSRIVEWIASLVNNHLASRSRRGDVTATEEEQISQKIETIRSYIYKNTPAMFMNNVLEKAMTRLEYMAYFMLMPKLSFRPTNNMFASVRWIEVLFTKDITFLSLNSQLFQICKRSFIEKSHLLTGLTTMKIDIDISRNDYEGSLCTEYAEFFKNIPNLKCLTITCRSNKILDSILDNCKSVIKLDLHEYYNVSTETFDAINQLPNLETVFLYDSSIDYVNVNPIVIESNKNTILKHIHAQRKFEVLSFVMSGRTKANLQFLKKYPLIERLECKKYPIFEDHDSSMLRYKESFNHLQHVKELKTLDYRFCEDQVKEIIQLFGRKLEKLQLLAVGDMDLQAFKFISQMCPDLKYLTVSAYKFLIDDFSISISRKRNYSCITSAEEIQIFENLQYLHLDDKSATISSLSPSTPSSAEIFSLFLLENCPNIEYIDLHGINLTQGFFLEVLDKTPLKYLKELHVPRKLDQIVIDRMGEIGLAPKIVISHMKY